jgi:hypothetical protein
MNGMLRELAAWMASNPEQFGLVVGAVVAMVLQGRKRLWGWESGDQTFCENALPAWCWPWGRRGRRRTPPARR